MIFFYTAVFSQDAAVTSLRYAHSSWKTNKPLLDKYVMDYLKKMEECKALKITNEAEKERLLIEKEKVRQELLRGSFCNKCDRSKSEIELAERIPFMQHIQTVSGTPVPASAAVIKKRMDEFDSKIQALGYAVMTCEGDAFMINGKITTYKIYVDSNVKTASQNIMSINSFINKELAAIIFKKNNVIAKMNKVVKESNDEFPILNNLGTNLDNAASKFNLNKKKLDETFSQKITEIDTEIAALKSQLEKAEKQEDKTKITNEIGTLTNNKYPIETLYRESSQVLLSDFEKEKTELTQHIDNQLNSRVNKINSEIGDGKSKLQDLANSSSKLLNYYTTNIAYINKVIAEMKLDVFAAVNINFNSDRLLHKIAASISNMIVKTKIGNDLVNANNTIATCQSLVDDIENVKVQLISK